MKMLQRIPLALILALPLSSQTGAQAAPGVGVCLPNGASQTVFVNMPPLARFPGNASWKNGTGEPVAWEHDSLSFRDSMGAATTANGRFSIQVTNQGGDIVGPNGAIVEDWPKDGCVEI